MKIPPDAIIPIEKLTQYLLRFRLHDDKSGLMKRLGFNLDSPNILMEALRLHASHGDAIMEGSDVYGDHFVLVGKLVGPMAERLIESVWVRRTGETAIRFVTLKPVRKST